ncbi:MAG TPA: SRPBCC family protein [Gemmatimonadales bacterium]|nr:SRPBCC family protein [Gemmatimonadales bacterium]
MSTASKSPPSSGATDRIQKSIVLRAPRSKVWRALTDSTQFGQWFGTKVEGQFTPGRRSRGPITIPGYEHLTFEIDVEQMEPERLFSWRWQPGGDPNVDPAEPMTLVVFELEEVPEGTRLTVTETGFDRIPADRRGKAFRENEAGWTGQMENFRKYVARTA